MSLIAPRASPPDWPSLLDPGERLLWSGRPVAGLRYRATDLSMSLFGLPFLGFGLFCLGATLKGLAAYWQKGGALWMLPIFLLFGLIFTGIGCFVTFGLWLWRERRLGRSFYALATHAGRGRALLRVTGPKPVLTSWPLHPATILDLQEDRLSGTADLRLADKVLSDSESTTHNRIGFERLKDARQVYALIRDLQTAGPSLSEPSEHP